MGIKCDYDYCIYNRGGYICMLKEIRMNCIGMCDNCITVEIQKEELEQMKHKQLQEIK